MLSASPFVIVPWAPDFMHYSYHILTALFPSVLFPSSYYFVSFSPCVAGEVTAFGAAALQARGHFILVLDT